ncbi:MAG: cadherin-like beta sandwich domain-containing protein [Clostridia bacterium]|nr:cadherin-like beta sandwich domain-containing protein [Clostridia bacterium]
MKKTAKLLTVVLSVAILLTSVFAIGAFAAGSTSVAFSSNSLSVGEKLTVTVKFSAPETMYAIEGMLNYDSSVLKFEEGEDSNSSTAGSVIIAGSANGKSKSVKITFSAIAAGSSTISLSSPKYVSENEVKMEGCGASISVKDKNAPQSSNANLKSLWISAGELSPAFSPNTTSYTIKIPYDKTVLTVSANPEDSAATVTVSGSKNMKVGKNKRVIKVTAGNGTVKEYVLNISRLDENGKEVAGEGDVAAAPEELKVVVNGNPMVIADNFPTENLPTGFEVAAYTYKEKEVSSITDGAMTLLYLTDEAGENGSFYEITADGEFVKFLYVQSAANGYVVLMPEADKIPTGYSPVEITVGETTLTAYRNETESLSDFVLIYAKGSEDYTGWYRYDTVEKTFQRAEGLNLQYGPVEPEPQTLLEKIANFSDNEKIAAITIVTVILLLIAALVVLIVKIVTNGKAKREEEEPYDEFDDFESVTVTSRDEE